uniref:Lipocalin n=1 Tax=Argas monolakensis TaxID=34602 RepID=Q09JW8_ARGMO|nr:lipocalin [Argas monolakensis]
MTPFFLALAACLVGVSHANTNDVWEAMRTSTNFYLMQRSFSKAERQCVYASINQTDSASYTYQFISGYRFPNSTWFRTAYWARAENDETGTRTRFIVSRTRGAQGQQHDLVFSDNTTCTILKVYNPANPSQALGCELWATLQSASSLPVVCNSTYTQNCSAIVEHNYQSTCPTVLPPPGASTT